MITKNLTNTEEYNFLIKHDAPRPHDAVVAEVKKYTNGLVDVYFNDVAKEVLITDEASTLRLSTKRGKIDWLLLCMATGCETITSAMGLWHFYDKLYDDPTLKVDVQTGKPYIELISTHNMGRKTFFTHADVYKEYCIRNRYIHEYKN